MNIGGLAPDGSVRGPGDPENRGIPRRENRLRERGRGQRRARVPVARNDVGASRRDRGLVGGVQVQPAVGVVEKRVGRRARAAVLHAERVAGNPNVRRARDRIGVGEVGDVGVRGGAAGIDGAAARRLPRQVAGSVARQRLRTSGVRARPDQRVVCRSSRCHMSEPS